MPVRGPDTRIPLMAQAPERIDPFGSIGKVLQIREMQRTEEESARKIKKQQQFEALASQYGDDPEELVKQVTKFDPETGAKLGKLYAETRTAKFSAYEKQLDGETKGLELATRELQAIPDGDVPTAAAWRARWVSRDPQLDKILPPPDQLAAPQVKQQVLGLGVSTLEFNKAKAEGVKQFIAGDFRKGLGNTLAVAPSLEAAKATLDEAEASRAVPKTDIALFRQLLTDSDGLAAFQAAAGNAALSEKERYDILNAGTDNQRQDDAQAETKRHNQATEAAARATNARLSAAEGGGAKPGDDALVESVIKMPGLYAGLTPTTKERIIGPLMARGFTGFSATQAGKPATGAQKKALGFFNQAKQAADEIETLTEKGMSLGEQWWANNAHNALQTQTGQAYNQGMRAFTEARLRKVSGAAVPESEYAGDRVTFFRQPGDSDATLAQKARARAAVLASIAYEAGPALHEFYGDDADQMLASYKESQKIGVGSGQQHAAKAPANVQAALSSKGAGRYTLSDGSVWQKSPDGSITKAQ